MKEAWHSMCVFAPLFKSEMKDHLKINNLKLVLHMVLTNLQKITGLLCVLVETKKLKIFIKFMLKTKNGGKKVLKKINKKVKKKTS